MNCLFSEAPFRGLTPGELYKDMWKSATASSDKGVSLTGLRGLFTLMNVKGGIWVCCDSEGERVSISLSMGHTTGLNWPPLEVREPGLGDAVPCEKPLD